MPDGWPTPVFERLLACRAAYRDGCLSEWPREQRQFLSCLDFLHWLVEAGLLGGPHDGEA